MRKHKLTKPIGAFLLFFAIALIIRLPYFFDADINWDESTFLLLGRSVLRGQLPYTVVLDNKPPLLWYCFAVFTWIANKSLVGIRLIGTICVVSTAFLGYLNIRQLWGQASGIFTGILLTVLISLNEEGQAVLSEHLALLPLGCAFTLLCLFPRHRLSLFTTGFLLTAATMTRLNLAYVVVFVGIYILVSTWFYKESSVLDKLWKIIAFSLGCSTVYVVIFIPYILTDNLDILYRGLIQAPLSFSGDQLGFWGVLGSQVKYQLAVFSFGVSVPLTFVSVITLFSFGRLIVWLPRNFSQLPNSQQRFYVLAILFLVSTEFSILRSGIFHDHYNIQLLFFISLLTASLYQDVSKWKRFKQVKLFLGLTAIAIVAHHLLQYVSVIGHYRDRGTPFSGPSFQIAEVIERENPAKLPVWIQTNHFAYWLTDTDPVTPTVTHPSSIHKPFLLQAWYGEEASALQELEKIIARQPILIVSRGGVDNYFPNDRAAQTLLTNFVASHYQPLAIDNPDLTFYKRLESSTGQ